MLPEILLRIAAHVALERLSVREDDRVDIRFAITGGIHRNRFDQYRVLAAWLAHDRDEEHGHGKSQCKDRLVELVKKAPEFRELQND